MLLLVGGKGMASAGGWGGAVVDSRSRALWAEILEPPI